MKIFYSNMAIRKKEKEFVNDTIGKRDRYFFKKNCSYCHVKSCIDCHSTQNNTVAVPSINACIRCHSAYFIGIEYMGLAVKEDNVRFKIGIKTNKNFYLKMKEDVHYKKGIFCSRCHTMTDFFKSKKSSYNCTSCHSPNKKTVEHRISEHLKNLECYSCHSSWVVQEYGTFFIRTNNKGYFPIKQHSKEYIKSSFLKKYDYPPLGLNERNRVSPIRPQFIIFFTDSRDDRVIEENVLLKAQWKAVFPHTVQRGSVFCDGCHFSPRRFLLKSGKIFDWKRLSIIDFWNQKGQSVENGSFFPARRFNKMSTPNKRFVRFYLQKWERFLKEGK